MDKEDSDQIMLALFDKKMTYADIARLIRQRKKARLVLNDLIEKQLISEEGRENWKHGKKLWYSLTEEGKMEYLRIAFVSIEENLKVIDRIISQTLSEPQKLEEWHEKIQTAIRDVAKAEELTLEEKIQRTMNIRDTHFGSFRTALRNMQQISLKLAPLTVKRTIIGDAYLHVNQNGVIDVLSEDELLKHPDITVMSM